ncbi:MAG TPA: hypothetical protein VMP00_06970 [Burkholderiales bacterium]|nr:hypothetical protein [Burkholderiales bacterium]
MQSLTLFARGFFDPHAAVPRLPVLEMMLARGDTRHLPDHDADGWLCERFGVKSEPDRPVAALTLFGSGIDPRQDFCLCADPVHLQLRHERLILTPARHFVLRDAESRTLADALDAHFLADGLRFIHVAAGRWCIRAGGFERLGTQSPHAARGRDIDRLLPKGEDAGHWMRIATEAQMLLHAHPVNAAREERGDAPVNAIWLWGGGRLPRAESPFDACIGADPVARALSMLSGAQAGSHVPDLASALRAQPVQRLLACLAPGDGDSAADALRILDRNWIAQAWAALRAGLVQHLQLVCEVPSGLLECNVSGRAAWRVWRRPRPLDSLLQQPGSGL